MATNNDTFSMIYDLIETQFINIAAPGIGVKKISEQQSPNLDFISHKESFFSQLINSCHLTQAVFRVVIQRMSFVTVKFGGIVCQIQAAIKRSH